MPPASALAPWIRNLWSPRLVILLAWGVWFTLLPAGTVGANENPLQRLAPYIDKGSYGVQVGRDITRSYNLDERLIPASTLKVLTALMALDTLGANYRFRTRFYLGKGNQLYIQGQGDPFLTSETITAIAGYLKSRGIDSLHSIHFDTTTFALEGPPPGTTGTANPYDAPNGALAVNFNSLPFVVTHSQTVVSGESQTPLLPLMQEIGATMPAGSYRVNVNAFPHSGPHPNMLRYCGELFTALFRHQGIRVKNGYDADTLPQRSTLIYRHVSKIEMSEIIRRCLRYSNNFIANQLFLVCGAKYAGYPATWKKARQAARHFIHTRLSLSQSDILMVDGSGLSRKNRVTASAMLEVLTAFRPYAELLPKDYGASVKSGTLKNVFAYAGYFPGKRSPAPFVILLNQERNTRGKILNLLLQDHLKGTIMDNHRH